MGVMKGVEPMEMEKPASAITAFAAEGQQQRQQQAASKPDSSILRRAGGLISGGIHSFFYGLGLGVAKRPWIAILMCVLVTLCCGAGMTMFYTENRGDELWVPSGTQSQLDKAWVEKYYGSSVRIEQFVIISNDDVLVPEAFSLGYELHQRVMEVVADNPKDATQEVTFDNYCQKQGPSCMHWNVLLNIFNYDESAWATRAAILEHLNAAVPAKTSEECAEASGYDVTQLLGGISYGKDGSITGARMLSFGYFMQNKEELTEDNTLVDPVAEAWEGRFLAEMASAAASTDAWTINYCSTRSFGDEFGEEIDGDVTLLMAAIFLVIGYATAMLSKWGEGCTGFRGLLCLGGVLSIGMAIICCFGICSALGLFYSPLMSVLPFLMLGIGVDDMFVIVNAFDNSPACLPIPQRVAMALGESGSSVTVTSITDILAFFIGSFTSLPALRNFSIYAAFGILFDYLFQVTFFVAFLVFDSRRRAVKSADCFCCCTTPSIACRCCACCVKPPHDDSSQQYPQGEEPKACCCAPDGFCATDNKMRRLLGALARLMGRPTIKALAIVLFAGIAGAGAYGMYKIPVEGDVRDFIPPGSYLAEFVENTDALLNEIGGSIYVYVNLNGTDLFDKPLLESMKSLADKMREQDWLSTCSVTEMPEALLSLYDAATNSDEFHALLKNYVTATGQDMSWLRYANDIYWDGDTSSSSPAVGSLRLAASTVFLKNSGEQVMVMDSMREMVEEHGDLGQESFAFSSEFATWEGYKSIGGEALRNIGLAMLMVLLVILLLLVHPLGSLITFGNICLVVVEILGFLYFWGLTIDNVSVIFIVISLGLCVDYSVHITHSFLHKEGTGNERMQMALEDMGTAVMNGVISTWIAVLVLAGSGSYVFATFFKALFLCTTLGLLHGIILLPIVLSLTNPGTVHSVSKEQQEEATALRAAPGNA